MRALLLAPALVLLAARPALPGAMLYATAASENWIDGFCLGDNGGLVDTPAFQRDLEGTELRRVLVHPTLGNVLYVAQKERISVFQIDARGRLTLAPNGTIPADDPRDLVVYGNLLYASLHKGQVLGFGLNPDGTPAQHVLTCGGTPSGDACSTDGDCPTTETCEQLRTCGGAADGQPCSKDADCKTAADASCIGLTSAATCMAGQVLYQDIAVEPGSPDSASGALLYVSGGGDAGRIDVYQLDGQGNLLDANGTRQTCPDVLQTCGGTVDGQVCADDADCPAGVGCKEPKTCGGTTDGRSCATDGDCPTDIRCDALKTCGGTPGPTCSADADCPKRCGGSTDGGACTANNDCTNGKSCRNVSCEALVPPDNQISLRRSLARPKAFQITNGVLYVEEKNTRRIVAFRLQPNGFCHYAQKQDDGSFVCQGDTPIDPDKPNKGEWKQPPDSKTDEIERYQGLLLVGSTLIGTQFNDGRLDAYTIKPDGKLPKNATRVGKKDPRRSPIRMTAYPGREDLLYVAGGILDRVLVFRLSNGLPDTDPFSQTAADRNAFPNDVAVAVFPDACQ